MQKKNEEEAETKTMIEEASSTDATTKTPTMHDASNEWMVPPPHPPPRHHLKPTPHDMEQGQSPGTAKSRRGEYANGGRSARPGRSVSPTRPWPPRKLPSNASNSGTPKAASPASDGSSVASETTDTRLQTLNVKRTQQPLPQQQKLSLSPPQTSEGRAAILRNNMRAHAKGSSGDSRSGGSRGSTFGSTKNSTTPSPAAAPRVNWVNRAHEEHRQDTSKTSPSSSSPPKGNASSPQLPLKMRYELSKQGGTEKSTANRLFSTETESSRRTNPRVSFHIYEGTHGQFPSARIDGKSAHVSHLGGNQGHASPLPYNGNATSSPPSTSLPSSSSSTEAEKRSFQDHMWTEEMYGHL